MRRWVVGCAVALCVTTGAGRARAERLLVLPVLAEGAEAGRAAEIQTGLDAAVVDVAGELEVVPPAGPTFCGSLDEACIASAGKAAGAARVLHTAARPVGETLSALLVLVPVAGGAPRKEVVTIGPGVAAGPLVRASVVRLVAPSRYTGGLAIEAGEGSELWVDGVKLGVAPLAGPLAGIAPGQRSLRVVRPGGAEARSLVEVRYATVTRVRIEPRSDLMEVVSFDEGASAFAGRASVEAPPVEERGVRAARIGQGVTAGIGLLALGAGVLFTLEASDAEAGLDGLRDAQGNYPAGSGPERTRLLDELDANGSRATISFVAGGALLSGAALWFFLDDGDDAAKGAALVPAPGGLAVTARF